MRESGFSVLLWVRQAVPRANDLFAQLPRGNGRQMVFTKRTTALGHSPEAVGQPHPLSFPFSHPQSLFYTQRSTRIDCGLSDTFYPLLISSRLRARYASRRQISDAGRPLPTNFKIPGVFDWLPYAGDDLQRLVRCELTYSPCLAHSKAKLDV